jgi:hypothetical protein
MSTASVRTRLSVRVAGAGCVALTALASASLAGCSGSTPSATPTTFSPGTGSATAKTGQSKSPRPGHSSPAARHSSPGARHSSPAASHSSPAASHSAAGQSAKPHRAHHPTPTAAPATGGGGTAGFQDLPLLAAGAAAILAGAGSIIYRRRVMRGR